MTDKTTTDLETFITPFRRQEVTLQNIEHEGGLRMLQIKIREGRRFTLLEFDADMAGQIASVMANWSNKNKVD